MFKSFSPVGKPTVRRDRTTTGLPKNWHGMSYVALYEDVLRDRPTPTVVVEAIMFCVRERGLDSLKEPANVERLNRCDAAALAEIKRRCAKPRPS
jgi:hypothetical protein